MTLRSQCFSDLWTEHIHFKTNTIIVSWVCSRLVFKRVLHIFLDIQYYVLDNIKFCFFWFVAWTESERLLLALIHFVKFKHLLKMMDKIINKEELVPGQ